MNKLEEDLESSKRTLKYNSSKRIHELYFMPTDCKDTFTEKKSGQTLLKGWEYSGQGKPTGKLHRLCQF
ncbi:MAG: hypothetical protein K2O91_08710 [Lachnospiraceae bacterium]|nr:hypothetical protein [Lachnospiraceae bacterium]